MKNIFIGMAFFVTVLPALTFGATGTTSTGTVASTGTTLTGVMVNTGVTSTGTIKTNTGVVVQTGTTSTGTTATGATATGAIKTNTGTTLTGATSTGVVSTATGTVKTNTGITSTGTVKINTPVTNSTVSGGSGAANKGVTPSLTPTKTGAVTSTATGAQPYVWMDPQVMQNQDYVTWAFRNGLTSFMSVEPFRYNAPLTRQESTKIIVKATEDVFGHRYASFPNNCNNEYKDAKDIDPTLKPTIISACAHDIMTGMNGYFMPKRSLTRAEALAVLLRAVDGRQNERTNPWYLGYTNRAFNLGLMTFANTKGMEQPVTRGELIEWIYIIAKNKK